MAARVCPIFDEQSKFIGLWALNPDFQASLGTLGELMSLAEPLLTALSKFPQRRVLNDSVEVGNGVHFQGGVFVMIEDNRAPNEELSRPNSSVAYVLIGLAGIACLMRTSRTDSRLTKQPLAPTPPPRGGEGPIETEYREQDATTWFKDASVRGGPHAPANFNLLQIPNYSLDEWAQQVSAHPTHVQCTVVRISELGPVTQKLFEAIKKDHRLPSGDAVKIFDEYLGAACPQCFGGLTGSMLQMVAAGSSMAAVFGGGEGFQRVLAGRCGTCESDTYRVVWLGDKTVQSFTKTESSPDEDREARRTSEALATEDKRASRRIHVMQNIERNREALAAEDKRLKQRQYEEERRAEDDRIRAERKKMKECIMCGERLKFFERIFGAEQHKRCVRFTRRRPELRRYF